MVLSFSEFCSVSLSTSNFCSESLQKSRGQDGQHRAQSPGHGWALKTPWLNQTPPVVWPGLRHWPHLSEWASVPGLVRHLSATLEPSVAPTVLRVKHRPPRSGSKGPG